MLAAKRPAPRCIRRLTISGSGGCPAPSFGAFSKAIARWIEGSPVKDANPAESNPARSPASKPRRRRPLTTLVTGKGHDVAPVMHKFMEIVARQQRCRALLGADEIDEKESQNTR